MFNSNDNCTSSQAEWQAGFVRILPEIETRLQAAFRHLTPDAREDAVEDGVIQCLLSYSRLFEEGHIKSATPASLARYSALHVGRGRQACCRMNSKEPLSRYAQLGRKFTAVPLYHCDPHDDTWINDVIDNRRSSVADQVAIKLDLVAWLNSLCRRTRNIAKDLARGFSTSEVARKYRLSASRVSQIRRELMNSWQQFQGEPALATAS